MAVKSFPRLKFLVCHDGKRFRYPLDPEVTVSSLQNRFARDSGLDLSDFHLRVNAPTAGTGYTEIETLLETDLLSELMTKALSMTHRRLNCFDVQFHEPNDFIPPVKDGVIPIQKTVFGQQAAAGLRRQRSALLAAAAAGRGGRNGRPAPMDTSRMMNSQVVLHISVHDKSIFPRKAPLIKVNEDSIAVLTYDLPEYYMVDLPRAATVGDLRRRLVQRLGTDNIQLLVPGHAAPIPTFDDDLLAAEHALEGAGCVEVRRTGCGVARVRLGKDALLELPVNFSDGLHVLIAAVRRRCPRLRRVQFHLRCRGHVLAAPDGESLGSVWDGVGELALTFEEKQPGRKARRKEARREEGVQRVEDMNDFLRLQSAEFNRRNANKLAPVDLDDFLAKINEELVQQPIDAPVTTQLIRDLPPSSDLDPDRNSDHDEAETEAAEEGAVHIAVPFEAARFITVFVKDADTGRVVTVDTVTASTLIYVFRRKLERLLDRNLNRYMLGYKGRFIVDEDRSLRELGILHGCRLVLEYEDDFESVGSSEEVSVHSDASC